MKIFYYTATGNSLDVAKRIGGQLYSIPQLLKENNYNVVGINLNNYKSDKFHVYESLKDIPHNVDIVAIIKESIHNYCIIDEMELLDIKNIYFEVTDEALLNKTGGIVQGMSGSPIVQNGKLIGAVTHVLIDDVTTGYGISIITMLEEGEKNN